MALSALLIQREQGFDLEEALMACGRYLAEFCRHGSSTGVTRSFLACSA
jgi:hypothetical protein